MIKLVIGCGENKNILSAAKTLKNNKDIKIEIANSDKELTNALIDDNVNAVIRGSLHSSNISKNIKNLNNNKPINRMSFIKFNNKKESSGFLLGPVGIDEGKTINEKLELAEQAIKLMLNFKKKPKIAILATGRKNDFGRNSIINKSIEESEKLVEKTKKSFLNSKLTSDFSVKNYYILIEKAIKEENNIIIAPDGIMGNIIFRSLVLLSSWKSHGAIALGMNKIFIDTSRDQTKQGYIRALKFAQKLVEKKLE